jgi:SAM-dependent methyltransferase
MNSIEATLADYGYRPDQRGIFVSGHDGYWSNLDKAENQAFLEIVERTTPEEAVETLLPHLKDIFFSPKREAGLELLGIRATDVCIDFGCMWGALSVGLAKRAATVISIDQTYDSLRFLNRRKATSELDNIVCVQDDIRQVKLKNIADIAIVNGVLEWIPEQGDVELKTFYGKRVDRRDTCHSPERVQRDFLQTTHDALKPGGRLYLAIENRFDFQQFIGKSDPHSNLLFTSVLPRPLANGISRVLLRRPYVNYLYSFMKLQKMLDETGFWSVDLYAVFPDYRFPRLILPYRGNLDGYTRPAFRGVSLKRKAATLIEHVLMRYFRGKFFAPSIIAIATR